MTGLQRPTTPPSSRAHLLQPPDLLLLLLQAEPGLLMLHLQPLPPLGRLPHVLEHKSLGQGRPAPPFPQLEGEGASDPMCSRNPLLRRKPRPEKGRGWRHQD